METDQENMALEVIRDIAPLTERLSAIHSRGNVLGFVPTMGALHRGHLSLIEQALDECDEVLISIFVNPAQFDNPKDLEAYPQPLDRDIRMLEQAGCRWLFTPSANEIYPPNVQQGTLYDLGGLDAHMEGKYRPGHFQGVAMVLDRFFSIVRPDRAYFGEKDFQQLRIVQHLVRQWKLPIEIRAGRTVREEDGLAMSSRNERLSAKGRATANDISKILAALPGRARKESPAALKAWAVDHFRKTPIRLEYLEIVDENNLGIIENWSDASHTRACVAAYIEEIRLLDNITVT